MNNGIRGKTSLLQFFINNKTLSILVLLMIVISLGTDKFTTYNNLMNVTRQITMNAIIGLGFTFVLTCGCIDLSVGRMLGMIGVITGLLSKTGTPFIFTVLAGTAIGLACGFINGLVITGLGLNPFIVTLAAQQVFKGMSNILANNTTIGGIDPAFAAIGQGYLLGVPIPVYIMVLLTLFMWVMLNRTTFGRHVVAIGGNAEAARVSGISIKNTRIKVYMLMGFCVSLASMVMNGRLASAQPTAGADMEMDSIAAVVLGGTLFTGGVGKVIGTVFGCMIIGVINNGLNLMNVNSNWQLVVKGLVIVLALLLDNKSEKLLSINTRKKSE